ncbi:MAG: YbfB/YjiJ family MFS transporter, partial [Acidimicrobiales bacterium]
MPTPDATVATGRGSGPGVRWTVGLVAASTVVSHALARSTYPILLPAMEDDLLANHTQAGALSTVNFVAYLAGVAGVTAISGRVEPARLLKAGLAVAATGFVALAMARGFLSLSVGQALAGAGSAAIWMSAPVLATGAVD